MSKEEYLMNMNTLKAASDAYKSGDLFATLSEFSASKFLL